MTEQGLKIFRTDTAFVSVNGPGDIIGLVYLMNPGEARPVSEELFDQLNHREMATDRPVETVPDQTMKRVIKFIQLAYQHNNMVLPKEFTIQVENRNKQKRIVQYPVHPLYMNKVYFLEACQGKIAG